MHRPSISPGASGGTGDDPVAGPDNNEIPLSSDGRDRIKECGPARKMGGNISVDAPDRLDEALSI